jgi:hypothetical protein
MTEKRQYTSVRPTETTMQLWRALAAKKGITLSAVLAEAIRHEAEREGLLGPATAQPAGGAPLC